MAEETAPTIQTATEPSMEQELETLFAGAPNAAAAPTPATATTTPEATPPTSPETSSPTLEQQLEAIEEPKPEATPSLTPEQKAVLDVVPNATVAQHMATLAQGYQNFTSAFARGDFDNVEAELENHNPQAAQAFKEHLYQKYVMSGEWVDRWIADKEGNPTVHRGMQNLQAEIAQLKAQLGQRQQQESFSQQQQRQQAAAQAYTTHLNGLFDKINFNAADRRWVAADMNNRIGSNPQLMQAILSGNLSALNSTFKSAVKEYVNRDKQVTTATAQTLASQTHKPPVATGATVVTSDALPDDVRQVKKGQEEAWQDQQLTRLFEGAKRKK